MRLSVEVSGQTNPLLTLLVSPAGERTVYDTPSGLVVRELDKPEGRVIPGTVGAYRPFFSPDGKWLGFIDRDQGTLKKVSLTGGAPLTLCKGVANSHGATWGADDTIVFTPDNDMGLWQVPAGGGDPRKLTKPDHARGEKSHRWPHYLPGRQGRSLHRGHESPDKVGRRQDRRPPAHERGAPHDPRRGNDGRLCRVRPPRVPAGNLHPRRAFRPRSFGDDWSPGGPSSRVCSQPPTTVVRLLAWLGRGSSPMCLPTREACDGWSWSTGPARRGPSPRCWSTSKDLVSHPTGVSLPW